MRKHINRFFTVLCEMVVLGNMSIHERVNLISCYTLSLTILLVAKMKMTIIAANHNGMITMVVLK